MSNRKTCIRCGRTIDGTAGICPFCNWNQAEAVPAVQAAPPAVADAYKPPEPFNPRRLILIAAGVVVMLVGAFLFGMVINRDGAPTRAPETLEEQAAEHNHDNLKPKRADTPLVFEGAGGIDQQPITSAPAETASNGTALDEYQRTDATAVSAAEYAQMAKRAAAEKRSAPNLVDPRSLSGPAYAQAPQIPQRRRPSLASARIGTPGVRTRPVPTYQPLPPLRGDGKARFTMLVGADGRVHDVNVERTAGGNTAALLSSIQRWQFKPATENGSPVAAPYSVEISFRRE